MYATPRGYSIHDPAAFEPVSLAEAKAHLRVVDDSEDTVIEAMIRAATRMAQEFQRRQYINATFDFSFDCWADELLLTRSPLVSVSSVSYRDEAGQLHTLDPSRYIVITDQTPGRIARPYHSFWPVARREAGSIVVRAVCGYGDAPCDVPETVKAAILLLVGDLFENREARSTARLEDNSAASSLLWIDRVLTV